jgi:hypothetical protein
MSIKLSKLFQKPLQQPTSRIENAKCFPIKKDTALNCILKLFAYVV